MLPQTVGAVNNTGHAERGGAVRGDAHKKPQKGGHGMLLMPTSLFWWNILDQA